MLRYSKCPSLNFAECSVHTTKTRRVKKTPTPENVFENRLLARESSHDFGRTSKVGLDHRRVNQCLFQLSAYLHRRMATVGAVQNQIKPRGDGST